MGQEARTYSAMLNNIHHITSQLTRQLVCWLIPLVALAALSGCGGSKDGGEAQVILQLLTLAADNPYENLAQLELEVIADDGATLLLERSDYRDGGVSFSALQLKKPVDVLVRGFDDAGNLVAQGTDRIDLARFSAPCCQQICFCSLQFATCDCGSGICQDTCF